MPANWNISASAVDISWVISEISKSDNVFGITVFPVHVEPEL